jgi:O-succinylbenzoate synthase
MTRAPASPCPSGAAGCSRPASAGPPTSPALPNFTLPGDTSASARYYEQDLTPPFVLDDGRLPVPTGPGIGVTPLPDVLAAATTRVREVMR